jgi:hypothetical protein
MIFRRLACRIDPVHEPCSRLGKSRLSVANGHFRARRTFATGDARRSKLVDARDSYWTGDKG